MRVGTSVVDTFSFFILLYHPHACGDKRLNAFLIFWDEGSSPCVWGQVDTFSKFCAN